MELQQPTDSHVVTIVAASTPVPFSHRWSTPPDPGFVQSVSQDPFMLRSAAPGDKHLVNEQRELGSALETVSLLAHLATFGVLGVLIRYGLGKLFDDIGHVTGSHTVLFHDLPANMFGCFFMGWVGCVLKKDILHFSQPLSLGLSTGLMGSITTFSSWLVKSVMVITRGFWLRGAELSFMSLITGMHTAEWLRELVTVLVKPKVAADNLPRKTWSLIIFLVLGVSVWTMFLVLTLVEKENLERRTLWLACVLNPPGVWLRWLLAQRNGKGLGSSKRMEWLPWGTLGANLLACTVGYVVSFVQLQKENYDSKLWIGAIQLGFLGCLSTVSTFVIEVYNLRNKPWRSYAYVLASLLSTTLLGFIFYSAPVSAGNYKVVI